MPVKKKTKTDEVKDAVAEVKEELDEVKGLVTQEPKHEVAGFQETAENIELLKQQFSIRDTKQLQMFLYQVRRTGLDPLARQIYAVSRGGGLQIQATIDGFRLIAERTGHYLGQTRPEFTYDTDGKLESATVGVIKESRTGNDKAVTYGTAFFKEFNKGSNWNNMPHHMLAKVAESHALRKAFPQELAGLYTEDEVGHQPQEHPVEPSRDINEDITPEPQEGESKGQQLVSLIKEMNALFEQNGLTESPDKRVFVKELLGKEVPATVGEYRQIIAQLKEEPF